MSGKLQPGNGNGNRIIIYIRLSYSSIKKGKIKMKNNAKTTVKNFLIDSKNLQKLHELTHIDFEGDYTALTGYGKFTARTINERLGREYENVLVFVKCDRKAALENRIYCNEKTAYVLMLDDEKFDNPGNAFTTWGSDKAVRLDTLWRKSDITALRKSCNEYLVIAYDCNNRKHRNHEKPDLLTRYAYKKSDVINGGFMNKPDKYISAIFTNHGKINGGHECLTVYDVIDKSGYNVKQYRDNLISRLAAEKRNKDKTAMQTYNTKKDLETLKFYHSEVIRKVRTAAETVNGYETICNFDRLISDVRWKIGGVERLIADIENSRFTSLKAYKTAFNDKIAACQNLLAQ